MDVVADVYLGGMAMEDPTKGFQVNTGMRAPATPVADPTANLSARSERREGYAQDKFFALSDPTLIGVSEGSSEGKAAYQAQADAVTAGQDRTVASAMGGRAVKMGKDLVETVEDAATSVHDWVTGAEPEVPAGTSAPAVPSEPLRLQVNGPPKAPLPSSTAGYTNAEGVFVAPNLSYATEGAVRSHPVNPAIMRGISEVAYELGGDIGVVVTSGGQASLGTGGPRTGSTRHDIDAHGQGGAADIYLTRSGERVRPADDPALYAAFIERGAARFPGIGHYEWGLHVGGGSAAFWGPDTRSASADPAFAAAYQRGRERSEH